MTTKNVLTNSNTYRLTKWVDENKEVNMGKTKHEIAELAQTALGFTVTGSNVYGACGVLGIRVGVRAGSNKPPRASKDSTRTVARHLSYLYQKLGEQIPASLLEIANR
jgi:hypothetical protein